MSSKNVRKYLDCEMAKPSGGWLPDKPRRGGAVVEVAPPAMQLPMEFLPAIQGESLMSPSVNLLQYLSRLPEIPLLTSQDKEKLTERLVSSAGQLFNGGPPVLTSQIGYQLCR